MPDSRTKQKLDDLILTYPAGVEHHEPTREMLGSMAAAGTNFPGQAVGWARRNAVYSAVRAGGGFVWSGHAPGSVAEARATQAENAAYAAGWRP